MEDYKLYVAKFKSHPKGPNRYAKDFIDNLSSWNSPWWDNSSEEQRLNHFEWALNHEQYHYSTDDINKADIWTDNRNTRDKDILAKYAPVDFLEVIMEIKHV